MASASFLANGSSPAGGVSVSASSTVNLALVSTTGVNSVAWSIVGNHHEDATNPTITPAGTPSGATASFTMPSGAGQAYLVRCRINGGRDSMGRTVEAYTFQAIIGVDTASGLLPFAAGETTERSATHGHTMALNAMAEAAGGGGTITGTGTAGLLATWTSTTALGNATDHTLKDPVYGVATTDIAITGADPEVDGITYPIGSRLLLVGQSNPVENGIWVVQSGAWTRAADMPAGSTADYAHCFVKNGDNYAETLWVCTTTGGSLDTVAVVGTDGINWQQRETATGLTAADIAFDDTNAGSGASEVQTAIDNAWVYLNDLLDGKTIATTTPAYVSGYVVQRPRSSDGAFITRMAANIYRAEKDTVTAVASTSATTVATLALENDTTVTMCVVLRGVQDSDKTIRADLFAVRISASLSGSTVTVNTSMSTYATPDGLPLTPPAWVGSSYTSLVTTSTSANTLNVRVTQAVDTAVTWYVHTDALVTGA